MKRQNCKKSSQKGKKHLGMSERMSGSKNPNWRGGGKQSFCVKCGKRLKNYRAKLCKNCENIIHTGIKYPEHSIRMSGFNHPNWKGGITSLNNQIRHCDKYKDWIKKVFERDNYVCQDCGAQGIQFNAHHDKKSFSQILKDNNIQTLEEALKRIEESGKRRKTYHHYIQTEYNRLLKQIDLSNIMLLAVENLKNVKKFKRGKFSRRVNRLLSFWLYAKVINRLRQICEESGTCFRFKSPWKTSQRCPICGNIDSKNRKKDKFCCTNCGFEENADTVAAMNLEFLGLAGEYSLRSLQNNSEAKCL